MGLSLNTSLERTGRSRPEIITSRYGKPPLVTTHLKLLLPIYKFSVKGLEQNTYIHQSIELQNE